jgi:hypothetical protein
MYSESHDKQFHKVLPTEKEELHTKVVMLNVNDSFVDQTISICDKEQ